MSEATQYVRQLPELTSENRDYWTGGEAGELRISHCAACGNYVHPPTPICPHCLGRSIAPQPVSGRARVVSFTVNRQVWVPGMPVPFILALVEIEEQRGVWIFTEIRQCEPELMRIGMPVRVAFEHVEDVWLPVFEPRDGA